MLQISISSDFGLKLIKFESIIIQVLGKLFYRSVLTNQCLVYVLCLYSCLTLRSVPWFGLSVLFQQLVLILTPVGTACPFDFTINEWIGSHLLFARCNSFARRSSNIFRWNPSTMNPPTRISDTPMFIKKIVRAFELSKVKYTADNY